MSNRFLCNARYICSLGRKETAVGDDYSRYLMHWEIRVSMTNKDFHRRTGMKQVRTSPCYPRSNGKLERWSGTAKQECIRPQCPSNVEEARRVMGRYANEYNNHRLHSAIGYVTPRDRLLGLDVQVWEERRGKPAAARAERQKTHRAKHADMHDEYSLNQTVVISDSV
ncbi:MAG: transposase [Chitinivibrionales bacterium]|nr:transposase [Chitinivibrionales bacterium]MBD3356797.1 transposase [Chitinivibrionales bacterium]